MTLWPAAVRRNFTLGEFARAPGPPADRLRADIPLAAAERGRPRISPDEDAGTHSGPVIRVYADPFAQDKVRSRSYRYPLVINCRPVSRFDNSFSTPAGLPCSRMLALPGCCCVA